MKKRYLAAVALAASAAIALTGCATGTTAGAGGSVKTLTLAQAQKAESADAFGGMKGLEAAAEKEGHLNVITLPPSWANYGQIIAGFEKKYPQIKINSENPDGSSADEVAAAKSQKGQSTAPDVFDLGTAVLDQNLDLLAPYKVQSWGDIQSDWKDTKNAQWWYDYTGLMSIGYDTKKFPKGITSLDDLLKPQFKNAVAIKGDPTQANEALSAVAMAALQSGGKADDIQPGIDFFAKLKQAGNFLPTDPTSATIESGQTPLVMDWDYVNAAESAKISTWKVMVPSDAVVGGYYFQAINKDAPHPAAARLWQEFLYSDQGQNLFLGGGARPVRADAMQQAGTIDKAALAKLPPVSGKPTILTAEQTKQAGDVLNKEWTKATS
jgi:putative spermidine/putrescine transport system substrate-binding protein